MATPHINGKGSKIVWFVNNVKGPPLVVQKYDFGPVVEEIADGVCGEETERLDRELKHYAGSLTIYNEDTRTLALLLKYDEDMGYGAGGTSASLGFRILDKKNGAIKLAATDVVIGSWKWTSPGQIDRSMVDIPIRCRRIRTL